MPVLESSYVESFDGIDELLFQGSVYVVVFTPESKSLFVFSDARAALSSGGSIWNEGSGARVDGCDEWYFG